MIEFDNLVEAHWASVFHHCYGMLGEPQAAEDATQETFLRAFQRLTTYEATRPFKPWLLTIANHHCIDRIRRKRSTFLWGDLDLCADHFAIQESSPGPEQTALGRERAAEFQELLVCLPSVDRCVLVLRYWYGMSYFEIATMLDTTASAVKSRLHRARAAFGAMLLLEEARNLQSWYN